MKAHQGDITVESQLGKGSCFKVTLKKGDAHFDSSVARVEPEQDKEYIYYSEDKELLVKEVQSAQSESGTTDCKLLVIDDNEEIRNILVDIFSPLYTVETASDGKEGYEKVKVMQPDLVISDIMMPEMRGDELCHKLKNDIETSHIPIILLTALNNDRNIIEGLKTGADEYIVKPFNIGILRAMIANILTNRSLLRHKYANLELNDEESDTACINCSTDIDWKFISTVKKSVEDNMDNSSFTVDVLCNLLNMSRTSFYNKIKALTDQAPADYIRLIRLKRAAQLLKEQQHSITEVAEMTGFSDAKYFREVFKKHFNVSPSQYAKQKEEDNNGKMI